MDKTTRTGVVEMIAAMLISGTIGWFVLVSGQPALNVVFWRCVIGTVALAVICGMLGLLRSGLLTRKRFALAVLGGIAIVANWLLLFGAYPLASISIATTVYNTQPFMLLALGALFFKEEVTAAKLFWLGMSFAGMVAIVQAKPAGGLGGADYALGIAFSLGAAFFYALAAIAAKGLKGTPPHLIALIQVATGVVMLLPFADFSDLPSTPAAWSSLATLGTVHTGLMYVLLYGAIQKLPTHLTGALSFIYPVAAILVDRIAFGHALQPMQVVGSAVILIAAMGMNLGWSPMRMLRRNAS
ncbi:DMT family transporter [Mycoplana dimorpha]|uniref:EamA domain-containing membrane protein RarD n=1 Tax=Mycoplana dimorpha TaxID=28320 RepID=A0A2T5BER6_MYCDI|nr:DMT family transporter [Mycoplana dimorpha]PTM97486.1 EamA domain-containing membrane protein RarD [Mycoplana dimorpha]